MWKKSYLAARWIKEKLIQKNSSKIDSINNLIERNNTILETNKVKFDNFNTLKNIIENEFVALITDKKHKKVFNQFSSADYPIKIIFKGVFCWYAFKFS